MLHHPYYVTTEYLSYLTKKCFGLRLIQFLLLLQNKTMQMMYETIYTALKEVGLENIYEPQDYLNFFCLGNREASDLNGASQNAEISPQVIPCFQIRNLQ